MTEQISGCLGLERAWGQDGRGCAFKSEACVPQLSYPFICWWATRLLPCPGYYKQCCNEHWGARVSFRSGFLGVASNHVYYQGWNRSPAQVGCMRQVIGAGALGRPRGMGWGGKREGGSGWGTHVNPWLIHVNVWQKPLQYYIVISFQLIKVNGKKKKSEA